MEHNFQVGDWIAKPHLNRLVGSEDEVKLEPKAMQVLSCLADRAGSVVSKGDLLHEVWDGNFVTEEVLANSIWEIRKALGDDARNPTFIQTVPKKGYRLIASVATENEEELEPVNGNHSMWFGSGKESNRSQAIRRFGLVLAVVSLAAAALLLGSSGWSTSGSTASGNRSIAIMGFTNHIGNQDLEWLSEGVGSMLQTGLAETPGLEVVSSQRVQQVIEELGGREETGGSARVLEVARRAGAGSVLVGSLFEFGSEIRIDAQVEDVASGKILSAHSVRGSDVFGLVDDLTHRVRKSLDVGADRPAPGIAEVTTDSLEAYRLYKEGVKARRHLRLDDSRRLLTEAVSVDPTFALAYWELQTVSSIWNDPESAKSYRQKMKENLDRLPERTKLMARAMELYEEDPAEAIRTLEELLERYPDEEDAYVALSNLYRGAYQYDKYMGLLERGVEAIPNSGYIRLYYGYGLMKLARFPEAIQQFEVYARINPREPNPFDCMGEAYLIAGLPERAIEEYGRALEIDPSFHYSRLGQVWAYSTLGEYRNVFAGLEKVGPDLPLIKNPAALPVMKAFMLSRVGRYREAKAEIDRGMEMVEGHDEVWVARFHLFSALMAVEKGDYSVALEETGKANTILSKHPKRRQERVVADLLDGIAEARAGRLDAARRHLASLEMLYEPLDKTEKGWYHFLEGEIALAEGNARDAAAAFAEGEPELVSYFSNTHTLKSVFANLSFRDGLARAKMAEGDRESAIEIYRKLVKPDLAQKWTAALEPRYLLEMARLHEGSGNMAEAREHYLRFVELWKDADPELPELQEAKRRVGT